MEQFKHVVGFNPNEDSGAYSSGRIGSRSDKYGRVIGDLANQLGKIVMTSATDATPANQSIANTQLNVDGSHPQVLRSPR